ncbi:MAG: hypothetical protein JL50_03030 [Peptococcaceae bacterium BICA1-7]|nr:MAG: hypothetical protein JL50_03030 [Peptococcaceae bacterium BICA1-7]HBV97762.1 hypothetical protein [Desulfotomaculum sp.]
MVMLFIKKEVNKRVKNIKSSHYGDCDYCKNADSNMCEECEHYEHDYYDYWEEVKPEDITKKEREEYEEAIKNAISDYITVELSEVFKHTFDVAKNFTTRENHRPAFLGVYMDHDGCMVASDMFMLCKLKCDCIPDALKGKIVVVLDNDRAGIVSVSYPNYKAIFNNIADYKSVMFSQITRRYEGKNKDNPRDYDKAYLVIEDTEILVNDNMLSIIENALLGEISVFYKLKDTWKTLFFKGSNGEVALAPARRSS